jgi:hypothetical protein
MKVDGQDKRTRKNKIYDARVKASLLASLASARAVCPHKVDTWDFSTTQVA